LYLYSSVFICGPSFEIMTETTTQNSRFPHPLVLLIAFIILAGAATYLLPAGRYERVANEATGRTAVVPGSYQRVEQSPVGPWGVLSSIQKGMIEAASVIFFVFLVGGAFTVVEQTGALTSAVESLVSKLESRPFWVIPISTLAFATGGATFGMYEETIAFIPILVLLARRLGFDALTGVAVCTGAAALGSGFGPLNPFNVGIAQKVAELPLFSGLHFRAVVWLLAVALLIHHTAKHARSVRKQGAEEETPPVLAALDEGADSADRSQKTGSTGRHAAVLLVMAATFGVLLFGVIRLEWGIDELATLFFTMGIAAGLIGGLGINGTARSFVAGFQALAFGALIIGFARAILVVLEQGAIIDTMVAGLVAPLVGLPGWATVMGMFTAHALLHLPMPSLSGQAMITMPILVPLSDLLNISRQVTVLAYQYGTGIFELVYPTQGALLAVLAIAGVRYDRWLRFMAWLVVKLILLSALALFVALAIGLK
jgi:uncharacterized ion transporter superfamily protein YfcC